MSAHAVSSYSITSVFALFVTESIMSVYAVCMLASLNAREGLRNRMAEATGITFPHIGSVPEHGGLMHMPSSSRKHTVRLSLYSILA